MTTPHPLGPTLETERLILRPPSAEDFEPWAAFAADPEVGEWLGGVQWKPLARRNICTMAGSWLVREGVLPEPLNTKVEIWGQTGEEWRARRSTAGSRGQS